MEKLVKGDIVVTPFPFSDLKSSTRRPALIVATLKGNDLILCQITSRNHPDPYQVGLNKGELSQGELSTNSFIKPSILFTLRDSIILYKIGRVNDIKIKQVENQICEIIRK